MRAFALLALVAATCTPQPEQSPAPPPAEAAALPPDLESYRTPVPGSCDAAYHRQSELGCPPNETGFGQWETVTCPALQARVVDCLEHAQTCRAVTLCEGL